MTDPKTSEAELTLVESKPPDEEPAFNFTAHRQVAVDAYQPLVPRYSDFARVVFSVLRTCLRRGAIKVNSIEYRAKDPESFGRKAEEADPDNPGRPKYPNPLVDITDLAGVRVITFFLSTEPRVEKVIVDEFDVVEKTDKSALLEEEERLGYHSIHYLVKLRDSRLSLPEYEDFRGLIAEIQVRTILQHAWAEIEHDIQYKAEEALPKETRRRFMSLAGMLEIADREFQALEEEDARLRELARTSVAAGNLDNVEITPDALKSYLDQKFGPDGRMSGWSYGFYSRLLQKLGFSNLRQVDDAIAPYDPDDVSRTVYGTRQGQLTRFEDVITAAMGDEFIERHFASSRDPRDAWWREYQEQRLLRLRSAGVPIGDYRPEAANKGAG